MLAPVIAVVTSQRLNAMRRRTGSTGSFTGCFLNLSICLGKKWGATPLTIQDLFHEFNEFKLRRIAMFQNFPVVQGLELQGVGLRSAKWSLDFSLV
jgi:hypothetical protein